MSKAKVSNILTLFLLVFAESVFAKTILKEGWIVKRHTPSSTYLIKQADVVARGYNWTVFFRAVDNSVKRIDSAPHNYLISAAQAADSATFGFNNKKDEIKFAPLANTQTYASVLPNVVRVRDAFGTTTGFNLIEGDMTLNSNVVFDVDGTNPYQISLSAKPSLEETLIHELGHGMSLDHTSVHRDNMGGEGCGMYANGLSGKSYIGQSMTRDLQTVYGVWNGGYGDLGITGYTYVGFYNIAGQLPYASCKYSDLNDAPPPTSVNLSEYRGYVRNGSNRAWAVQVRENDRIKLKFTVEATKAFTNVPATVYFSTDTFITTTDVVISNWTLNLNYSSGAPFVWELETYIPYTSHRGFAAIGVIIDPSGSVSEWSKNNNVGYFPIYIVNY